MSFSKELLERLGVGLGDVVVIATKRGGGKSYLATRIAGELARERAVTFFAQELTHHAVQQRMTDMGLDCEHMKCACFETPYADTETLIAAAQKAIGDIMVIDPIDFLESRKMPNYERMAKIGRALAQDAVAEKRVWIATTKERDTGCLGLEEVADVWIQPNWGTRCFEVCKIQHGTRDTIPMPNDWPMKNISFPGA